MQNLEKEILSHISKIINSKKISLWETFQSIDSENNGFITSKQFLFMMQNLGIYLSDGQSDQLLDILNQKLESKRLKYTDLETRLLQHGLEVLFVSFKVYFGLQI